MPQPIPELPTAQDDRSRHRAPDRFLLLSLGLALIFCIYGIHWGVVESWHPDQIVYQNVLQEDELPLRPANFLKPPFHTYLALFLVRAPIYVLSDWLGVPDHDRRIAELLCARLLTVAFFLGQIVLVFAISRAFFGVAAARATSILLASSAGFVAFGHFLTVDIPVTFWMLLAFWCAQNILLRGRLQDYVLAGLFTGVAAATKYNGLAIGISIVCAHWLSSSDRLLVGNWAIWRGRLFDRRLVLGIAMVAVGFTLANPFFLVDFPAFMQDFMYNLVTTPVYEGPVEQNGYWLFLVRLGEIFGLPGLLLIGAGALYALVRLVRAKASDLETRGLLMLITAFALYYAYFGSFGRLETRFVLPIAPYSLMMIGPLCGAIRPRYAAAMLGVVLSYNVYCSLYVGWRFTHDPRMSARAWIAEHIAPGSSIEYSAYTPRPARFPDQQLDAVPMPYVTGRVRQFQDILAGNPWVEHSLQRFERSDTNVEWYSSDALMTRSPDYIWLDSLYYGRFFGTIAAKYYQEIGRYFSDLLDQKMSYDIVYDAVNPEVPRWVYPQEIDYLDNRIVILQRRR